MIAEDESVIHLTRDAAWLPAGSRAEVILAKSPPRPMSVVRLLILRKGTVFCVPRRDRSILDLPMQATSPSDVDGSRAIRALADIIVGRDADILFVGAVRNVVDVDDARYGWPTPHAHFGVWATDGAPIVDGAWVSVTEGSPLADRHWFPLLR